MRGLSSAALLHEIVSRNHLSGIACAPLLKTDLMHHPHTPTCISLAKGSPSICPKSSGTFLPMTLWQVGSLLSGMQSFEASAELQPGWARFLRAWESTAPAQCAAPLA